MANQEEGHCDGCRCDQDGFVAARLDIWKTAQAAMFTAKWPEMMHPDARDVMALTDFLSGAQIAVVYQGDDDDDPVSAPGGGDEEEEE